MHFHIFVCNQYVLIIRSTLQKEYLDRTCHIIPRSRTHLCHVTFTIHADSAVNLTARRDASLKFCGRRFILVFLFSFSLNCTNSYVRSTQMYRVVYRAATGSSLASNPAHLCVKTPSGVVDQTRIRGARSNGREVLQIRHSWRRCCRGTWGGSGFALFHNLESYLT